MGVIKSGSRSRSWTGVFFTKLISTTSTGHVDTYVRSWLLFIDTTRYLTEWLQRVGGWSGFGWAGLGGLGLVLFPLNYRSRLFNLSIKLRMLYTYRGLLPCLSFVGLGASECCVCALG